jgi:hypothetical protein
MPRSAAFRGAATLISSCSAEAFGSTAVPACFLQPPHVAMPWSVVDSCAWCRRRLVDHGVRRARIHSHSPLPT